MFWRHDAYGALNTMMQDMLDMPVVHGEPQLHESMERRNKKERAISSKKLLGFEVDGLFQAGVASPENVGVVEAAKRNDEYGMKDLCELNSHG